MIRRLSAIAAWLTAGHAVLFAMFWLLLAVPESNVFMILASALVVAAMTLVFGIVEGAALVGWQSRAEAGALPQTDGTLRHVARAAWRALPAVWLGAVFFLFVWLLTSHLHQWWDAHRGETDAWFMAQFGWSETARLHAIAGWFFRFLSYVVAVSLGLGLAWAVIRQGLRPAVGAAWAREALSPRRLLTITAILLLFLWLPWQAVNWRPGRLSPNWQESIFVAVKLGLLFVVANVGWALVLGAAVYRTWSQGTPLER